MATYGNEHRLFLQGIMASGILDPREVTELYIESCEANQIDVPADKKEKMAALTEFIRTLNRKLEPLSFEIVKAVDEDHRNRVCYYVFRNKSDRLAGNPMFVKFAVDFSPNELDYLRLIMVGILKSKAKELSRTAAVNLASQVGASTAVDPGSSGGLSSSKRFTGPEGEKAVEKLVRNRWLRYSDDGAKIRLSPRFLEEMQPYLMRIRKELGENDDENSEDEDEDDRDKSNSTLASAVGICDLCNKMVIRSVNCGSCRRRFHLYCLNSRSDGVSDTANCPCNQELRLSNEATRDTSDVPASPKRKNARNRRKISASSPSSSSSSSDE